ncbi:hypothetical protein VK98_10215 [Chromobacterium sp. LK11]|uniref:EAL domain-containing response regulator n=1 Tax=Chromobacterium sp. LK11 TaxID=1628212 RepID=UPI000653294C|nr:EAL domain-containing protein [Chromobacterium sp. LK11]KMN81987.1 hypothetical protein VK98_10215 [Chromobacterium sp. LK11]
MGLPAKRFLILEDQLVLRKLISRQASFFSRYEVAIDEFSDPAEALRSIGENHYDLIVTDIGMPGMNGIDFIKHVALLGYRAALLIISGYDGKTLNTISEMACSLGIGSTRFLSKPYSAESFLTALNSVFNDLERAYQVQQLDVEGFFADICSGEFKLEVEPILGLPGHRLAGFDVTALIRPQGRVEWSAGLFSVLARRKGISALVLEELVARIAGLLAGLRQQGLGEECGFNVRIDKACLESENLFDHCHALLQQRGVSPRLLGFELAEGLGQQSPAQAFENVAKIKYLGFRLIADHFGAGSLTQSNMLKLPFDHVNIPVESLQWIRAMLGADPQALRFLRIYGLPPGAITASGADEEEDVSLAQEMGCPCVQGAYMALPVRENELSDYLRRSQETAAAEGGAG